MTVNIKVMQLVMDNLSRSIYTVFEKWLQGRFHMQNCSQQGKSTVCRAMCLRFVKLLGEHARLKLKKLTQQIHSLKVELQGREALW